MSLSEILTGGSLLLVLMTLVQISPIRINPWSWIAKRIGKAINGEVIEKVNGVSADLQAFRYKMEERDAELCRTRILRFGDELLHQPEVLHTQEHFEQILEDIDVYENYCKDHPKYKNNKAVVTIMKIKRTYEKCMYKNTFL